MGNKVGSGALPAMGWGDGNGVNPAAMAIVSGHDCANDSGISDGDKEKLIVNLDLLINDQPRIVVRRLVTKDFLP